MDTIHGIKVDFFTEGPLCSPSVPGTGILVVTFDCDSKHYILPFRNTTPRKEVQDFIRKACRTDLPECLILRNAMHRSKLLKVTLENLGDYDEETLLALKYQAIRKYQAYYPSGYNLLFGKRFSARSEAPLAQALLKEVLFPPQGSTGQSLPRRMGRPPKEVFMMTQTGDPVRSFSSIKEASEFTGLSISAISKCCRGELDFAGGYFWTYDASFYNAKPADK